MSIVKAMILTVIIFLLGCPPGSRYYQPVTDWEKQSLDRANRNIFPDDVRGAQNNYHDTVVAWPGIIIESKFVENQDHFEIQFILGHHYYDWIEDFSVQREKFFLSPRGEGLFRTSWKIKKDPKSVEDLKKMSIPGNLIIAYGIPERVNEDGSITVKSIYVRLIEKQWYRTDILNYDRPGQPANLIKLPHQ